jgi:hypothetical protein
MPEPTPRKNCPACGATACFDATCSPEVVARADAFAALAPEGFYTGPVPPTSKSCAWAKKRGLRKRFVQNTIMAAQRKYPRLRYAFTEGDFSGWPELDSASRLGGYEAALDVAAGIIARLP